LKPQGFNIVSLNSGDDQKTILDYAKKGGFTFPLLMHGETYAGKVGVMGYPTNYLLDAKGKVINRFIGFNESEMVAALKKSGFKL
jgi:hypothetical protein